MMHEERVKQTGLVEKDEKGSGEKKGMSIHHRTLYHPTYPLEIIIF
jgi:hypothetical protein